MCHQPTHHFTVGCECDRSPNRWYVDRTRSTHSGTDACTHDGTDDGTNDSTHGGTVRCANQGADHGTD
jgi:hypothetical protein